MLESRAGAALVEKRCSVFGSLDFAGAVLAVQPMLARERHRTYFNYSQNLEFYIGIIFA